MSVVLMYHALYTRGDTSQIDAEDLPYAVSADQFRRQLDAIADRRVGILGPAEPSPDVVITFDDGHASNHEIALPLLLERGMSAYFFVTTGFVGQRRGFCSPSQVNELSAAGMVVGGHGVSHTFFDDLDDASADRELRQSRESLQNWSGAPVESMSFPGGRYTKRVVGQARRAGYAHLFGSDFGATRQGDLMAGTTLRRIPVRNGTNEQEFLKIVGRDARYYATQAGKGHIKWLAKRALGNRIYHGLYKSISIR